VPRIKLDEGRVGVVGVQNGARDAPEIADAAFGDCTLHRWLGITRAEHAAPDVRVRHVLVASRRVRVERDDRERCERTLGMSQSVEVDFQFEPAKIDAIEPNEVSGCRDRRRARRCRYSIELVPGPVQLPVEQSHAGHR
jgi:hypothetical protein